MYYKGLECFVGYKNRNSFFKIFFLSLFREQLMKSLPCYYYSNLLRKILRLEKMDEIEMSVFFSHPKLIKINLICYLPPKVCHENKTLMVTQTNWLVLLKLLRVN